MPLKIVRNDITKMKTEAIVNTANDHPTVGTGCDYAIYKAAGYDDLLSYRKEHIGIVPEGQAFLTPGFRLDCRYIIHAVSPHFIDGESGEEALLRSCYQNALRIAVDHNVESIAFPLISTGGFGYPKEEGFRIAVDEINAFLLNHDMLVYIVVFGKHLTSMGRRIAADLESYIDENYVEDRIKEEYDGFIRRRNRRWHSENPYEAHGIYEPQASIQEMSEDEAIDFSENTIKKTESSKKDRNSLFSRRKATPKKEDRLFCPVEAKPGRVEPAPSGMSVSTKETFARDDYDAFETKLEDALQERVKHLSDTFSEYLMYLIESRGMKAPDVYKGAIVDKKAFSKIKNNKNAHPKKMTAMCLCVGAKLNLDQTKDLLARAGYALSPSDKTDVIFSFFIENEIYDMIELDIQLENHGLPCLVS